MVTLLFIYIYKSLAVKYLFVMQIPSICPSKNKGIAVTVLVMNTYMWSGVTDHFW